VPHPGYIARHQVAAFPAGIALSHLRRSNSVPETLPGFSSSDSDEPSHPEGTSFVSAPAAPPDILYLYVGGRCGKGLSRLGMTRRVSLRSGYTVPGRPDPSFPKRLLSNPRRTRVGRRAQAGGRPIRSPYADVVFSLYPGDSMH